MVQSYISSGKQHSSVFALLKCCEAVLREKQGCAWDNDTGDRYQLPPLLFTLNYSHERLLIHH